MSFPINNNQHFTSFTSQTLPHWSGPAYYGLILMASFYISSSGLSVQKKYTSWIAVANILLIVIVISGIVHINNGLIKSQENPDIEQLGRNDFTLDMYGWDDAGNKIDNWVKEQGFNERLSSFPDFGILQITLFIISVILINMIYGCMATKTSSIIF